MNRAKSKMILAINPGSTSTKIAVYRNYDKIYSEDIGHALQELSKFNSVMGQLEYRRINILHSLEKAGIAIDDFACVVGRGGQLKPIPAGTYYVNAKMLDELKMNSDHASSLGAFLAKDIAARIGVPSFIVDPISVDEMRDLARITGIPTIERVSIFHALSQKAAARRAAAAIKKSYKKTNLIVAHLGGGISVGVHKKGKVIDVNNALNGDGPFAPTRAGGLPVWACIEYALSSGHSIHDLKKSVMTRGGLIAHLGTDDMKKVKEMIKNGDRKARLVYESMAYQVAKEIGAGAAVLCGKVDAVILTGGLARDKKFVNLIKKRIAFIARILVYTENNEMEGLVHGALRVLDRKEKAKEYK
jgi:butyrate kinase